MGLNTNQHDQPYILAQRAIPVILAPNGTVATNGIATLGTALPTTYSGGAWVRLPANAVVGGLAGLYWVVFASTTAGQVYTNFVDAATQFIPHIPTTLIAAVGSNAAYTQTTGADITLANITVPGGAMGLNGALWSILDITATNPANANAKTVSIKSSGVDIGQVSAVSGSTYQSSTFSRNRGVQNAQRNQRPNTAWGIQTTNNASIEYTSVNTAIDRALTFTGRIAVATDYIVLEAFAIEVLPS